MARGKKTQVSEKKVEEPVEADLPKASFVGLNKKRKSDTRMRIRDQLCETNKTIEAEMVAQRVALDSGMQVVAPLTMTEKDCGNFAAVLEMMKVLWNGLLDKSQATDTKVITDLNACIAMLGQIASMEIKVMSSEDKATLEAEMLIKAEEAAALLAELDAAKMALQF